MHCKRRDHTLVSGSAYQLPVTLLGPPFPKIEEVIQIKPDRLYDKGNPAAAPPPQAQAGQGQTIRGRRLAAEKRNSYFCTVVAVHNCRRSRGRNGTQLLRYDGSAFYYYYLSHA